MHVCYESVFTFLVTGCWSVIVLYVMEYAVTYYHQVFLFELPWHCVNCNATVLVMGAAMGWCLKTWRTEDNSENRLPPITLEQKHFSSSYTIRTFSMQYVTLNLPSGLQSIDRQTNRQITITLAAHAPRVNTYAHTGSHESWNLFSKTV